ncbi:hypothetical protein GCM10009740_38610 [Terrabacter terrae]|uniref:Uncharacterized protein n=1 Tax=Terrabacter terrae TaxID=318434 RepID=A0ABN1ZQM5_9MICO
MKVNDQAYFARTRDGQPGYRHMDCPKKSPKAASRKSSGTTSSGRPAQARMTTEACCLCQQALRGRVVRWGEGKAHDSCARVAREIARIREGLTFASQRSSGWALAWSIAAK